MDINYSIALLDNDIKNYIITSSSFVHMKSKIQGSENATENWTDMVPYYLDEEFNLKIGNYLQHGVFQYEQTYFVLKPQ